MSTAACHLHAASHLFAVGMELYTYSALRHFMARTLSNEMKCISDCGIGGIGAGAGVIGGEKDCFEQELAGPLSALKPHQIDTLQLHIFLRPAVASHIAIHRQRLMQRTLCLALAEYHGGMSQSESEGRQPGEGEEI